MKRIVCAEPRKLRLEEAPEPTAGPSEAIVRIRRVGVCGTDIHAYRGEQPYFTYPRVLGHELAGVVETVVPAGDGCEASDAVGRNVRPGDAVAVIPYLECGRCVACRGGKPNCCVRLNVLGVHIDGGMCERLAVPLDHLIKTDGLTYDQAVIIEPLAIGAHAVRRADVQPGETALVVGGGPIGLGVMAFAKAFGARVVAMDLSEERLTVARAWAKADETVCVGRDDSARRLAELTDGDGPTVVFDATGNARSMRQAFDYVAHGGRLVFVGLVKDDIAFSDAEFHRRELTLLASRNATHEDFERVLNALRSGIVTDEGYVTHRVAFEMWPDVFEAWTVPGSGVIKGVLEW